MTFEYEDLENKRLRLVMAKFRRFFYEKNDINTYVEKKAYLSQKNEIVNKMQEVLPKEKKEYLEEVFMNHLLDSEMTYTNTNKNFDLFKILIFSPDMSRYNNFYCPINFFDQMIQSNIRLDVQINYTGDEKFQLKFDNQIKFFDVNDDDFSSSLHDSLTKALDSEIQKIEIKKKVLSLIQGDIGFIKSKMVDLYHSNGLECNIEHLMDDTQINLINLTSKKMSFSLKINGRILKPIITCQDFDECIIQEKAMIEKIKINNVLLNDNLKSKEKRRI